MNDFAKILQHPQFGQVVVLKDTSLEDHPAIRIFMRLGDEAHGVGTQNIALVYFDHDGNPDSAMRDRAFDELSDDQLMVYADQEIGTVFRMALDAGEAKGTVH